MTIHTILVANRGAIASRIFRAAREMGYRTVAVFTDADEGFPFVREADQAVRLRGRTVAETYLDSEQLLQAAARTDADAIHPGYGFLAESAAFAEAVEAAGLTWIGPRPKTIELLGSKIEAKRIAERAGVPTLGWAVTEGQDPQALIALAEEIGYPLLVKASAGGGGRGIRRVDGPHDLGSVVEAAARESASAFGDGSLLLERLVENPRHIEVQIVADAHGNVASLFERECSVQRRFQKVIEECPSPSIDESVREAMCSAAVALARAVDYRNVGTVEYVVDSDNRFYFLEMNTRLQVEHGVTEEATGVDLVRVQLAIADGHPLPAEVTSASLRRAAIEARVYAEDPGQDFLPVPGPIRRFVPPAVTGVRVESAIETGTEISPLYDPMLVKLIGVGDDREMARRRLLRALESMTIDVDASNVAFLTAILRHEKFVEGRVDTGFIARNLEHLTLVERTGESFHAAVSAVVLTLDAEDAAGRGQAFEDFPSGWSNTGPLEQVWSLDCGDRTIEATLSWNRAGQPLISVDRTPVGSVRPVCVGGETVTLELDGVRHTVGVRRYGRLIHVTTGPSAFTVTQRPRFPEPTTGASAGVLSAPMPGTVVKIEVAVGDSVRAGDRLAVLESMKMERTLVSGVDGTVTDVLVAVGDQVDAGTVLVVVDDSHSGSGR